ncbi:unnamed protein product [Cuscuta europaea]|nr:unnamed protein product [Cuscuta europaea]
MQRVRVSSHQFPVHRLGDSQMTLSPKFRLAPTGSILQDPSSDTELALMGGPLIPGLPDDVALNCLLRVPIINHDVCRDVCKRWYLLFGNKEWFFSRRKELSFRDPWLFVSVFDKRAGKIEWKVFDLTSFSWHTIPAMPCTVKVCPHGFRCVALPCEGVLFVCGGSIADMDCPINVVLKFEVQSNRWTVMKSMITPRSFFACGLINGMVYVAGGNSTDLFELGSGEVLDPKNETWRPIANMRATMASYDAAVLDGKLLVTEGWFWPFYVGPRGQIYDPRTDHWEGMSSGLREGWTGSSVVIDDNLFVVPEHERAGVKVYDKESDGWNKVDGLPLPEQIRKPFCVNCCDNKIVVVGRNLQVALGHITRRERSDSSSGNEFEFCVQWEVVDAPKPLYHLLPTTAQVLLA